MVGHQKFPENVIFENNKIGAGQFLRGRWG
jgi:hypothetical protein